MISGQSVAGASLRRRLLSLIYEALIIAAVLLAGTLPVAMLTQSWGHASARLLLQAWLLALCGLYFVWQWVAAGQTLPMKTWRLRVVMQNGTGLTTARALLRYFFALGSTFLLGSGFLWALVDRERLFLHDRLAGTRIVNAMDTAATD